MGTQTTVPCAQVEDSGLLGPLQSPNWVKVCLVSTVSFLPVSIVLRVVKCLGLSVGDRVLCLDNHQQSVVWKTADDVPHHPDVGSIWPGGLNMADQPQKKKNFCV